VEIIRGAAAATSRADAARSSGVITAAATGSSPVQTLMGLCPRQQPGLEQPAGASAVGAPLAASASGRYRTPPPREPFVVPRATASGNLKQGAPRAGVELQPG
jgi:hypothetical protein